ncbi:MAG: hypothetical protein NXI22_06615 [bacterium]|nr:hypothetical protein [bacterium]
MTQLPMLGQTLQIGLHTCEIIDIVEWPVVGTLNDEQIWMYCASSKTESPPVFLASSVSKLAGIANEFDALLKKTQSQAREDEWNRSWMAFSEKYREIDLIGYQHQNSYWASMTHEYLHGF